MSGEICGHPISEYAIADGDIEALVSGRGFWVQPDHTELRMMTRAPGAHVRSFVVAPEPRGTLVLADRSIIRVPPDTDMIVS